MTSDETDPARRWSWTRRRGRATVRATFEALKDLNPVTQTFYEDMELEAHEDGVRRVYRQRHASRMVFLSSCSRSAAVKSRCWISTARLVPSSLR